MPAPRPLVVLLKSADEDLEIDPYQLALENSGLDTAFIPVLEHGAENEYELWRIFHHGTSALYGFGGVIFTSSRAAEMWVQAAKSPAGDMGCAYDASRDQF